MTTKTSSHCQLTFLVSTGIQLIVIVKGFGDGEQLLVGPEVLHQLGDASLVVLLTLQLHCHQPLQQADVKPVLHPYTCPDDRPQLLRVPSQDHLPLGADQPSHGDDTLRLCFLSLKMCVKWSWGNWALTSLPAVTVTL